MTMQRSESNKRLRILMGQTKTQDNMLDTTIPKQVTFWADIDDDFFVLNQYAKMDVFVASSLIVGCYVDDSWYTRFQEVIQ